MARRFSRPRGRLGSRRETSWNFITPTATVITGGGSALVVSGNAALLAKRPFTIIRTHIYWSLESDQVVATENYQAAIGMAVVSDQASAIGVTAVPTPITDQGSDLFYLHSWGSGSFLFQSAIGVEAQFKGYEEHIDSKAMRKMNDDQDLVLTVEATIALSDGVSIFVAGRFLIKES